LSTHSKKAWLIKARGWKKRGGLENATSDKEEKSGVGTDTLTYVIFRRTGLGVVRKPEDKGHPQRKKRIANSRRRKRVQRKSV